MGSTKTAIGRLRVASVVCIGLGVSGCNRAPREPEVVADHDGEPGAGGSATALPLSPRRSLTPARKTSPTTCVHPLQDPPPAPIASVELCPAHPATPPKMPTGQLRFLNAPEAPLLQVELAEHSAHRAHGLMYRVELPDDRGMLFSWPNEEPRSFWMKNTCLALDMLFIDQDGLIVGILRNVPPMNEIPRTVPCPAAHVLEVRAGWTEQYRVEPGQKIRVTSRAPRL